MKKISAKKLLNAICDLPLSEAKDFLKQLGYSWVRYVSSSEACSSDYDEDRLTVVFDLKSKKVTWLYFG